MKSTLPNGFSFRDSLFQLDRILRGDATVTAQVLLAIHFRPLIQKNIRHRWIMRIWIFIYAFVGIEAGYVLRPFIDDPNAPTDFLRRDSFQDAYVKDWG